MYIMIIIMMNVVDNLNSVSYKYTMYEIKMYEFTSSDHPPQ
jgi:hypothetical protein